MSTNTTKKQELFALVDCNSFYCSCERVFKPQLEHKPVIVLSNNDGCAVSRTNEAKALGIRMGDPYFKIRQLCQKNKVAVFSSNYVLYGDMSRRVMQILEQATPTLEVYSIDEAFLSFTGFEQIDLISHCRDLRARIRRDTGIPVSVGLAPTKVLAKLANFLAKKSVAAGGVVDLRDFNLHEKALRSVGVGDIWGIGRQSTAKLHSLGIFNAWQLRNANEKIIQKTLTILGSRIVRELRGESCIELNSVDADRKEILCSRSFGKAVFRIEDLREAIANHVSMAAEKLRRQNGLCHSLIVFIQTNPHKNIPQYANSGYMKLLSGTSYTPKLIAGAFKVLEQIYRQGFEYKKSGVIFTDLSKKSFSQMDFFSRHDSLAEDHCMKTLDLVNRWQGRGSLKYAACGLYNDWKMLSDMRSPCYTTRWRELMRVAE